ncbi:GNAT family N-acetyltransferase [Candidatus Tisiphia endosymbiont of Oplodontha viridula]|uniref:GNAT family N-acetyltransferase n=1 Tax=Candidatus Tisiphia endosymbiont of Oplodontha viridula TaxID=3077925 RepID=UPI0035C925B9
MKNQFYVTSFDRSYTLLNFDCGVEYLNKYLTNYAIQDIKRHLASVFVCVSNDDNDKKVIGYYTLSSSYIDITKLDKNYIKKLPHYPYLPAVLIGRFAIDRNYQGKKIGEYLLMDSLYKVFKSEIAAFAAIADAKDSKAASFYKNYGFIQFIDTPNKLFLPMTVITKIFS